MLKHFYAILFIFFPPNRLVHSNHKSLIAILVFKKFSISNTLLCASALLGEPFIVKSENGIAAQLTWHSKTNWGQKVRLPNGTHDLTVFETRAAMIDVSDLPTGPFPSTKELVGPRETIIFTTGQLLGVWRGCFVSCRPTLSPRLKAFGTQLCKLRGRLSERLQFRLSVSTHLWPAESSLPPTPAWPKFDANYTATWPQVIQELDKILEAHFEEK